ncbi:MAG: peptidylprolyl isomerase [Bacteroidia bacterium]|nr:peptidylprolyl isomerase [Bacteroidia bacterium]
MRLLSHLAATCLMLIHFAGLTAQPLMPGETLDRIVAVIGDDVILESDVDNQYDYLLINGERDNGTLRCQILENLIISKLLLNKARQDSIEIGEDQVESELDRRMEYFISQVGTEEFERIYGKSVAEFRLDIRDEIRNDLLVERMRGTMQSEVDVTPKEVKDFFKSLNPDSIGLLPAEVMINQIVITPPFSESSEQKAQTTLADLRRKVLEENASFEDLAARNTDEPGGRSRKGDLGWFGRGQMVPEFEEVAFQMRVGDVSEPFKTEFGYHIIKLYERRGERLRAAHILKKLEYTADGDAKAIDSLNKLRTLILADSFTFEQAAIRYSSDRITKHCGGCISNPENGDLRIPMDALDPDLYFKIDELKAGEVSKPMEMRQADGSRAFHILYLKKKLPPHRPNLKDDYQKIQNAALQAKQAEKFEAWMQSAKKNIYIDIKPTECSNALKFWTE